MVLAVAKDNRRNGTLNKLFHCRGQDAQPLILQAPRSGTAARASSEIRLRMADDRGSSKDKRRLAPLIPIEARHVKCGEPALVAAIKLSAWYPEHQK
jgi:hypothetical protein